jgi:hypothetical protein
MTTLRQLAEAWIQWHCETDDLRFEGGSSNTNKVMRAYVEAANPSAILDLLDTIDAQRKVIDAFHQNNFMSVRSEQNTLFDSVFSEIDEQFKNMERAFTHLEATK